MQCQTGRYFSNKIHVNTNINILCCTNRISADMQNKKEWQNQTGSAEYFLPSASAAVQSISNIVASLKKCSCVALMLSKSFETCWSLSSPYEPSNVKPNFKCPEFLLSSVGLLTTHALTAALGWFPRVVAVFSPLPVLGCSLVQWLRTLSHEGGLKNRSHLWGAAQLVLLPVEKLRPLSVTRTFGCQRFVLRAAASPRAEHVFLAILPASALLSRVLVVPSEHLSPRNVQKLPLGSQRSRSRSPVSPALFWSVYVSLFPLRLRGAPQRAGNCPCEHFEQAAYSSVSRKCLQALNILWARAVCKPTSKALNVCPWAVRVAQDHALEQQLLPSVPGGQYGRTGGHRPFSPRMFCWRQGQGAEEGKVDPLHFKYTSRDSRCSCLQGLSSIVRSSPVWRRSALAQTVAGSPGVLWATGAHNTLRY